MAKPEEKKTDDETPATDTNADPRKVPNVLRTDWGVATHRRRDYDCTLPKEAVKEDLEKPGLWNHVAGQLSMWDTIRAVANDGSFVAELIVTYKFGSQAKCQITSFTELQSVNVAAASGIGRYECKQRGQEKWCILDRKTGEVVRKGIPSQTLALKELSDFLSTLAG